MNASHDEEFDAFVAEVAAKNPGEPRETLRNILSSVWPEFRRKRQEDREEARWRRENLEILRSVQGIVGKNRFVGEEAIVLRLREVIGEPWPDPQDPRQVFGEGKETGADVVLDFGSRRVGVQVTEFATDYDTPPQDRGVRAHWARDPQPTGWVPAKPVEALRRQIQKKCRHNSDFNELWLVVATQVPWAPLPTWAMPLSITPEDLRPLSDDLSRGPFSRVFVLFYLSGGALEWSRETGAWRKRPASGPPATAATGDRRRQGRK
jgi:hypothetical protein